MNTEESVPDYVMVRPDFIEPSPPHLLHEPLEFLFAEHFRHRQMCRILAYLAQAQTLEAGLIAATDDFIRHDLALHVIDEEEDLFPLLRRRCEAEDTIEDVLGRLSSDHALDQEYAREVRAYFAIALDRREPLAAIPGASEALVRLAQQEKSHMALENAVVMPLARRRLQPADLTALATRLAARRGLALN